MFVWHLSCNNGFIVFVAFITTDVPCVADSVQWDCHNESVVWLSFFKVCIVFFAFWFSTSVFFFTSVSKQTSEHDLRMGEPISYGKLHNGLFNS